MAASIFLAIDSQDVYFRNNTFRFLFSEFGGAALFSEASSLRSTLWMEKVSISHIYSSQYGAIYVEPAEPEQSLILKNSTFDNVYAIEG